MNPPLPPPPDDVNPSARDGALAVVRRLHDAGHTAYFAGGCVRDLLLGRPPKDYDVATDAPPARVRALFPRTQAVGAAFGVILVRQGRSQVEVATFRADGNYADGRRPDAVRFTTAEEDAQRRDFTINGLFLDPLAAGSPSEQVIDYVGGRADLSAGVLRAIGDAEARFAEDHLRMLRAVRFAARFGLRIEARTEAAIARHATQLARISPERIAEELRAMLMPPTRVAAWAMLHELGLAAVIFRFVEVPASGPDAVATRAWDAVFPRVAPGEAIAVGLALAAGTLQRAWRMLPAGGDVRTLLEPTTSRKLVAAMRQALRISNDEAEQMQGALDGLAVLLADEPPGVARLKRFLARSTAGLTRALLVPLTYAGASRERVASLRPQLAALEQSDYAPPPLITGDDLTAAGHAPGRRFKKALDAAYDAQLEGRITTRGEAMALASTIFTGV